MPTDPTQPARTNRDWWPDQLDLTPLRPRASGPAFDYAAELRTLDVDALQRDLEQRMTTSQDWWPADYGHYGPLFIRLSWHAAGTYRVADGRGGAGSGDQRFAPLNSWPDNANLDKARRLLWPIKQKYGRKVSWADLLVFAGNVALESMGFRTLGFGFGREDGWEPEVVDWGSESTWLAGERTDAAGLRGPLAATQMGLIYVNPEGPGGKPDPRAAAHDIRETFARMAMSDEETAALIVGGHTFGKAHGAGPAHHVGPEPEAAPVAAQGLGWASSYGTGRGADTITSGLEGAWTAEPTKWGHGYLQNLYGHEWEVGESPAGAKQWKPAGGAGQGTVPDAHDPSKRHAPMMLTTDLSMRLDPKYAAITQRFREHPEELERAFAKAWYKLLHRDMGPLSRYLGPRVAPPQPWQDPVPPAEHPPLDAAAARVLRVDVLAAGLSVSDLVTAAWASASTFRRTDKRGGANGARVRLAPQAGWEVNEPERLTRTLQGLEGVRAAFEARGGRVSLADLIVLGGCAAVEKASADAGYPVEVPFTPGRTDATQEHTDPASFAVLEPVADAFRNYLRPGLAASPGALLVERANLLGLSATEMTVLLGGMRALGANVGGTGHGVLTHRPGVLSTDFFVNLLDPSTGWAPAGEGVYEGRDRATGQLRWTATEVDLLFGANAQLRAVAEYYAAADAPATFARDFAAVWAKVADLDRFDVTRAA